MKKIDVAEHHVQYKPQEGGGYVVYSKEERLGFVRLDGGLWHCANTYLERVGNGYRKRGGAVQALLRRKIAHK